MTFYSKPTELTNRHARAPLLPTTTQLDQFSYVRPLPLHTVQLPEPPHFEQTDFVNIPFLATFSVALGTLAATLTPFALGHFGRLLPVVGHK